MTISTRNPSKTLRLTAEILSHIEANIPSIGVRTYSLVFTKGRIDVKELDFKAKGSMPVNVGKVPIFLNTQTSSEWVLLVKTNGDIDVFPKTSIIKRLSNSTKKSKIGLFLMKIIIFMGLG